MIFIKVTSIKTEILTEGEFRELEILTIISPDKFSFFKSESQEKAFKCVARSFCNTTKIYLKESILEILDLIKEEKYKNFLLMKNAITDEYRKVFLAIPEMLEVIKAVNYWFNIGYNEREKKNLSLEGIEQAFTILLEKHGDKVVNEE